MWINVHKVGIEKKRACNKMRNHQRLSTNIFSFIVSFFSALLIELDFAQSCAWKAFYFSLTNKRRENEKFCLNWKLRVTSEVFLLTEERKKGLSTLFDDLWPLFRPIFFFFALTQELFFSAIFCYNENILERARTTAKANSDSHFTIYIHFMIAFHPFFIT